MGEALPFRWLAQVKGGPNVTEVQRTEEKQWSQIVARAWSDQAFKSRLLTDPRTVLREHGLDLEPDIDVKVVESTAKLRHFILPTSPAGEMAEEELNPAPDDYYCGWCRRCGCGRCGCGCYKP